MKLMRLGLFDYYNNHTIPDRQERNLAYSIDKKRLEPMNAIFYKQFKNAGETSIDKILCSLGIVLDRSQNGMPSILGETVRDGRFITTLNGHSRELLLISKDKHLFYHIIFGHF